MLIQKHTYSFNIFSLLLISLGESNWMLSKKKKIILIWLTSCLPWAGLVGQLSEGKFMKAGIVVIENALSSLTSLTHPGFICFHTTIDLLGLIFH